MLIAPLLPYVKPGAWPTVFGLSGYSGAGTISSDSTDPDGRPVSLPKVAPETLGGGARPYALTDHIHEREAGYHLSQHQGAKEAVKVGFIPAITPWFSGIISTMSLPLNKKMAARDIVQLYEEMYKGEKLVTIKKSGVPELKDIADKHGWTVGGFQVHSGGESVVVVGGLDNLLKGAATQCLQNLNLALGYDELTGIPH